MTESVGRRFTMFVRSLVVLAVMALVLPLALMRGADSRFGGRSPLHGVRKPTEWRRSSIEALISEPLAEHALADVVIRIALVMAWAALVAFIVTVAVETVHMAVHGGLHMPDLRGLGLTQRSARRVAAGLLAIVPMFGSARVLADTARLDSLTGSTVVAAAPAAEHLDKAVGGVDHVGPTPVAPRTAPPVLQDGASYVVAPGDSVYAIATRFAGPDPSAVAVYADRLLDLNLGREMSGGRRFDNAALIDVGWVLQLPVVPDSALAGESAAPPVMAEHVVQLGESLWSIANDELGDGARWPEVFGANQGRVFEDGRSLTDPSVIQPGWTLAVVGAARLPSIEPTEPIEPVEPVLDTTPTAGASPATEPQPKAHRTPRQQAHTALHHDAEGMSPRVGGPEQVWVRRATLPAVFIDDGSSISERRRIESADPVPNDDKHAHQASAVLSGRRAAMLSAGLLLLLACRRRRQLREAAPRARLPVAMPAAQAVERSLRLVNVGDRVARVDVAVRSVASALAAHGRRLMVISCAPDGELELIANGDVRLAAPWQPLDNVRRDRWTVAASATIGVTGVARTPVAPCPSLVQLGVDERGWDVHVDLEAVEAIEVGGPVGQAQAIVTAVGATLAASPMAELTNLISVGIDDAGFFGHPLHRSVSEPRVAIELAQRAVGSTTSMAASTLALRVADTSGEQWEPAVVLIGTDAGADRVIIPPNRKGLAVVSATPIHGPSATLSPDGALWHLRPIGIRLQPFGLEPSEIAEIVELVDVRPALFADHTVYEDDPEQASGITNDHDEADERVRACSGDDWSLMVSLMGPVTVLRRHGELVDLERSKTRELLAWLVTHRDRSTRANARTALWEQDVRDATFANVVSDARRALARAAAPPEGTEWVGRTMTEALPLHPLVVSDADLVERALATARRQSPTRAIATLEPAVELIGGVPFEGTTYLWPDAEGLTSHLVLLAMTVTSELAAHYLSVGDVEGVFRATGRGLRVLPGHEELIGLRMRAHARAGDHAGVRQEWESYERMIVADTWSDGEPSPKLVELRHRLLHPTATAGQS